MLLRIGCDAVGAFSFCGVAGANTQPAAMVERVRDMAKKRKRRLRHRPRQLETEISRAHNLFERLLFSSLVYCAILSTSVHADVSKLRGPARRICRVPIPRTRTMVTALFLGSRASLIRRGSVVLLLWHFVPEIQSIVNLSTAVEKP